MSGKFTPGPSVPKELNDAITSLRIAQRRYEEARREVFARARMGSEWMAQKPLVRTVEQAAAYVGADSAEDARRDARKAVAAAVEGLLSVAANLDYDRARGAS